MNETNAMWRELKRRRRAKRDAMAPEREGRLAKAVADGVLDAAPLGVYGWRLMANGRVVDYWPRTSRWRTPDGKQSGIGWKGALRALDPADAGR